MLSLKSAFHCQVLLSILLLLLSCSVVSDSWQPHGLQHTRLPCPSLSPGVCSNSCPLIWWCHPTISSSVAPFSSCPQSFPASGSFLLSPFFISGSQRIGVSALVLPMNIQGWSPSERTGWISLLSKGLSRVFSNISPKASILQHSAYFMVQLSHPYMTTRKTIVLNGLQRQLPALSESPEGIYWWRDCQRKGT